MRANPSFDAIMKRAVRRMTDKADGDWSFILRINEKARNVRERRAAQAFIDSLKRPLPTLSECAKPMVEA